MEIFDGNARAKRDLAVVKTAVAALQQNPKIVSIFFAEDEGSVFYSQKKQQAAQEVGIEFEMVEQSFATPLEDLISLSRKLVNDEKVNGIMIQKPRKNRYIEYFSSSEQKGQYEFETWWRKLTETLPKEKDVDGLSPQTQALLAKNEESAMMPATMKAVLKSLEGQELSGKKILIIGRSDLLGVPLELYWRGLGREVTLMGRRELAEQLQTSEKLREYQVIVSATGQANLIKVEIIGEGVILIDAGEPQADMEWASVMVKASLITPVPGGIGPVTIVSLLENAVELTRRQIKTIERA